MTAEDLAREFQHLLREIEQLTPQQRDGFLQEREYDLVDTIARWRAEAIQARRG